MTHRIHRRLFLQSGFAAVGGSLLAARTPFAGALARQGSGRALPDDNGRLLIVVQLHGGNDGLNTVVPYSDPRYRQLRPTLALAEDDLLPLDSRLALAPSLAPMWPAWEAGELAIVENVGYPNPDLSHFRSEAIWYTAHPENPSGDGWLGRWAGSLATPGPLLATTVGPVPSPATASASWVAPAVADPDTFGFDLVVPIPEDSALRRALLHEGYVEGLGGGAALEAVAATGLAAEAVVDLVASLPEDQPPVSYPDTPLGRDLATAVRLLDGGLGVRVAWTATGGYDTHADQAGVQPGLLADLAGALSSLRADLAARGLAGRTAVLVWTEFGRRPAENASLGTDHGTANVAFLLGTPVQGGVVGSPPDLDHLDAAGNLVYDVDFRSLYETVLAEHLGVDPRLVLDQRFERLGLFRR